MSGSFNFNGQRRGETVRIIVPANPKIIILPMVKMIASLAIVTFLLFAGVSGQVAFMVIGGLIILALYWLFEAILMYRGTVSIITTERIIITDQRGIWQRKISEVEVGNIQEMVTIKRGIINHLLSCGDLCFKTVGSSDCDQPVIRDVSDPYDVQQKISNLLKGEN